MIQFPISGVETYWWLPPLIAFVMSTLSATGGLSGAFLLLPFQVSVLGFTGPGVSPTNLLFNVVGIPSGVYRYAREKRMVWSLAWLIVLGTVPGMLLGAMARVYFLPDPAHFKPFAGFVLAAIGIRMALDVSRTHQTKRIKTNLPDRFHIRDVNISARSIRFTFNEESYQARTMPILLIGFAVGMAGGAYGIGGGAVIAPLLISTFRLPVYAIAGAALFSTFVGSAMGVLFYWLLDLTPIGIDQSASPDWLLGGLLGIGGACGMYAGARMQRFVPARLIKILLTLCLLGIAGKYLAGLF